MQVRSLGQEDTLEEDMATHSSILAEKIPSMEQVAPGLQKFQDRMCCVLSRSVVSDSTTPWTVACQASLSMGILQARILEWVAMSSSGESSQTRDRIQVSCIAGGFFTVLATTREAQE